jgi:membrane fusion protein (multidrug efflux system)
MNPPQSPTPSASSSPATQAVKRRQALLGVTVGVLLIAAAWGAYEWLVASHYESTDNAYVQGHVIQITPQVGGTVQRVMADDTDFVKAGQALIQLDPADARVALDQAKAQLAQAVRQVRTLYATNATLSAQVELREAEARRAQSELQRAEQDLARRQAVATQGAVSNEELGHAQSQVNAARHALAAAQAAVLAAREQLTSNRAMTDGTSLDQHPSVQLAATRVREAWLADQRGALLAPAQGLIARRTVQVGQRVSPGVPLMSLIPLDQMWVDANFKEGQLRHLRLGQPVELVADLYGKKVVYRGQVAGLGAGTGSAFALLPPQNATGNWIKVVQRVPVRIAIDPAQLKEHPLRVGLSMVATVDISNQGGKSLSDAPRAAAEEQVVPAAAAGSLEKDADAEVRRVIAAHAGATRPAH